MFFLPIYIGLKLDHDGLDSMSYDESSSINQDGAGPSDPQSFSETLKTRLQSVSTKLYSLTPSGLQKHLNTNVVS
jgi:hypothetical protein